MFYAKIKKVFCILTIKKLGYAILTEHKNYCKAQSIGHLIKGLIFCLPYINSKSLSSGIRVQFF